MSVVGVNLARIWTECGKTSTRKTLNTDNTYRIIIESSCWILICNHRSHHIETSQMIYTANPQTDFSIRERLVAHRLVSRSTADLLRVAYDRNFLAFSGSGTTRVVALGISKAFRRDWYSGILHKLLVRNLTLFYLFSVTDGFERLCMNSVYKSIQLMLVFLETLFLVLQFFYYTLITFTFILSVILQSMPMIVLSTLSLIRYPIHCNNFNWIWPWI